MISDYVLRLLVMLPLVCAVIVGGLFVARRVMNMTGKTPLKGPARVARLTESLFLTPGTRLAVVDFADKRLLLAVTKGGVSLLSEAPGAAFELPREAADAR